MNRKYLRIFLALIVIIVFGTIIFRGNIKKNQTENNSSTSVVAEPNISDEVSRLLVSEIANMDTTSWKEYISTIFGIKFKYPPNILLKLREDDLNLFFDTPYNGAFKEGKLCTNPALGYQSDHLFAPGYWIDGPRVGHSSSGMPINGADVATFMTFSDECARDKNIGYRVSYPVIGSDPATFTCLDSWYAKDKSHIYYGRTDTKIVSGTNIIYFFPLGMGYARDDTRVYIDGNTIEELDPGTFIYLGGSYSKDIKTVLYGTTKIENADVATFRYVNQNILENYYGPYDIATDKNHAYRGADILVGLKPGTLQILKEYLKDDSSVYLSYPYMRVEGADAATFKFDEIINQWTDKNYLYYMGQRAMKLEIDKQYLGDFYSKNVHAVFYKDIPIPNALADSFTILYGGYLWWPNIPKDGGYAKDNRAVYFAGKEIANADAKTFEITNRVGYSKDKNNQYKLGEKIKNDFSSCGTDFKALPEGEMNWYSKIKMLDNNIEPSKLNSFIEFCLFPDGSKIIGFIPSKNQGENEIEIKGTTKSGVKHFYLFDIRNKLVNTEPVILDCQLIKNSSMGLVLHQSLDVLDGGKIKLQCAWGDACDGRVIYQLDLEKILTPSKAIIPTDEFYDCGYRG